MGGNKTREGTHTQSNLAIISGDELKYAKIKTPFSEFIRKFKKQKVAIAAGIVILIFVAVAICSPWIAPYPYDKTDYKSRLQGPSLKHLAGTDKFGRDIMSRIIIGSRVSMSVGVLSVTFGAIAGVFLGIISGFFGGLIDSVIMRICDILFAFPGLLLAIAIIALLGPGLFNVIIAIAIFSTPTFARIIRGATLSIKETVYVEAARSLGASKWRLMFRHILPGTSSSIIVYFTMRIGTSILTSSMLSFLGLGAPPPYPEWGALLADGRAFIGVASHIAFFPGITIFIIVLAFNVLGDGLRDSLDPKIDNN